MKVFSIIFLFVAVIAYCCYEQFRPRAIKPSTKELQEQKDVGIKWNDSLFRHLPAGIDTSVIVKDSRGNSLKFAQYIIPVFNHEAIIFRDRNVWRLHRLNDASQDSLKKDDYALSSRERWDAWRNPDTITSWKLKLNNIKHTLSQADHILVLKSKRRMIISRKGKQVTTFKINMGFKPTGNKVADGDGRTPEGIYYLDNKYERGDKFHKSFLINYPNANDKLLAKQRGVKVGFGISIHGTPAKKINSKDWTAGCIALQNDDIDSLFNLVGSGTMIEIRK
ncbi:MAG: hypothetical protein EOO47_27685 [Flavobacterium sp.]|nr:MAG: hypothetical protein EOO47_27685 [Flavobacterium sp.]